MADMGRFERQDSEASHLPENLGMATEGLRSTIEQEVARIVESAQARAAEIEDQALEKANRVDQGSERRLEQASEDSRQRLARMLFEIDAVERSLGEAVRSLRAEAQALKGELNKAGTEPFAVEEPPLPAAPPPPGGQADGAVEVYAEAAPDDQDWAPEPGSDGPPGELPDPEVRELIRQQLMALAEGGRTRSDAERMLLRFRQGEQYFDLLDEIYPEATPGRRGLLRRRKAMN
jgi:hypothetical protein